MSDFDDLVIEKEPKFVSNPGSRYRPVYTPDVMSDGQIDLVQTGVEDLQEYIDSFKDSCDISIMVQRYLAGDETALTNGNPVFMDLTGAPNTLADAYALNFRAQHAFENLPASVREKFDNNFYKFLSDAGTPEWFSNLKMEQPIADPVNEEVSAVEK